MTNDEIAALLRRRWWAKAAPAMGFVTSFFGGVASIVWVGLLPGSVIWFAGFLLGGVVGIVSRLDK